MKKFERVLQFSRLRKVQKAEFGDKMALIGLFLYVIIIEETGDTKCSVWKTAHSMIYPRPDLVILIYFIFSRDKWAESG